MTVSEILKNDNNRPKNLLLTFFSMKIANESQFNDTSNTLMALEETTGAIDKLRKVIAKKGKKGKSI